MTSLFLSFLFEAIDILNRSWPHGCGVDGRLVLIVLSKDLGSPAP